MKVTPGAWMSPNQRNKWLGINIQGEADSNRGQTFNEVSLEKGKKGGVGWGAGQSYLRTSGKVFEKVTTRRKRI